MDYPWYVIFFLFFYLKFSLNKYNPYNWFMHVTMDKWMNITNIRYVIVSRYNIILVSLFLQQNMTFFPLRSQPQQDSSVHHIIFIGPMYDNHFV